MIYFISVRRKILVFLLFSLQSFQIKDNGKMQLKNLIDAWAHPLRISPQQKDIKRLIQKVENPKPAVLLLHHWGRYAFLQGGCQVFQKRHHLLEQPDIICGSLPSNLVFSLQEWSNDIKKGGMILLFTWPFEMPRTQISASFLHAGLAEVSQQKSGAMIMTAGTVLT